MDRCPRVPYGKAVGKLVRSSCRSLRENAERKHGDMRKLGKNLHHLERIACGEEGDKHQTSKENSDTIAAIQEVEELKRNPNKKTYRNFSEILSEIQKEK